MSVTLTATAETPVHELLDRYYRAALAFVNRERRYRGHPPLRGLPRGTRTSPGGCPVARGIGYGVIVDTDALFERDSGLDGREIPVAVSCFIAAYDEGAYPALMGR